MEDELHPDEEIKLTREGRKILKRLRRKGAVRDEETTAEDCLILEVLDHIGPERCGSVDDMCGQLVNLCGTVEGAIGALRAGAVKMDSETAVVTYGDKRAPPPGLNATKHLFDAMVNEGMMETEIGPDGRTRYRRTAKNFTKEARERVAAAAAAAMTATRH